MDFNLNYLLIETPALRLQYSTIPWDTEITGFPVAEIIHLSIRELKSARKDFTEFESWLEAQGIQLCSCRIPHEEATETMFLQEAGFRFIELHYEPKLVGLQETQTEADSFEIVKALSADRNFLEESAGKIFKYGRFHQDNRLGADLGNKRYKTWMKNSFFRDNQTVLKCLHNDNIVAFFVVEYPTPKHCHWSLIGMTPEYLGEGLAKDVWRSVLSWNKEAGIEEITTSISSHNTPVLNLFAALGFRFPTPTVTFHWMPNGFTFV